MGMKIRRVGLGDSGLGEIGFNCFRVELDLIEPFGFGLRLSLLVFGSRLS